MTRYNSSGTGHESAGGARRNKPPMTAFNRSNVELNKSPGSSSTPVPHGTLTSFCSMEHRHIIILQQLGKSLGMWILRGYHSGKPLGAGPLTRYITLAACCLLSCCDLGLSCLGCLFALGSCLAGVPFWPPPLVCLPIQVLGGNGGGTPFTGCWCMNPAF